MQVQVQVQGQVQVQEQGQEQEQEQEQGQRQGQRQGQGQVQQPMRGSFASLKDDGEKRATATASANTEVSPLRFAPVEMTGILKWARVQEREREQVQGQE